MADINSNLPVRDTADGTPGAAVPALTQQIGGSDGTNLRTLATDTTGKLNINNISGTISLPTLAATSTIQTNGTQKTQIVDGSGNVIASTLINSKQRLDVDLASEAADGATSPFNTLQIGGKDASGNLQTLKSLTTGEAFVRDLVDIAGQNRAQSVTTTAAEALGGATILANRKVLNITPTNGTVFWGYSSGVTTASGSPILSGISMTMAVSDNVHIFVIAAATTDCRIAEGS